MNTIDPKAQRRSRLLLILVALIFAAPMLAALVLGWGGWQPGVKGNGLPITPQRNFAQEKVQVRLDNGRPWAWQDSEPRLTLIALAGPGCATRCFQTLTGMAKARTMLNRNQSRLRLLYLGAPPADAAQLTAMRDYWSLGSDVDNRLASFRPTATDSVSAILVESNGTALSLYPTGFDVAGLARDTQKVVK